MFKSKGSSKIETYAKLLAMFPDQARPIIDRVINNLPSDMQEECKGQLDVLQGIISGDVHAYDYMLQTLQRLALPAVSPISNIAIVGAVNVGKSTLYNALLAGTCAQAEVSPVPGTTKVNQEGQVGLFKLIDTPGFAHGAEAGIAESDQARWACEESDFLIVVFDASRGVTNDDKQLFDYVTSLEKPFIVVLNKQDLISTKELTKVKESCANDLGLNPNSVNVVSAVKGKGVQNLLLAAAAHEPRLLAELGRSVPALRSKFAWQSIRRSAVASAFATIVPIPVIDFIPLTAIQCSMVVTIARIYNKPINKTRAMELLSSFGVGLGARTLFQQLSKLAGPPGWVLSMTIATATTIAIGGACVKWFSTGVKPSNDSVNKVGSDIQKKMLSFDFLKRKSKPSKKQIGDKLTASIEHLTQELEAEQESSTPTEQNIQQEEN